ncbi:MAG: polysaccharide deacetylase family protein [Cytophagaceae bacterium]
MSAFIIVRTIYIVLILLLLAMDYFFVSIPFTYYLLPTAAFLVILFFGSADIKLNFFIRSINSFKTTEKTIALTFDDGPSKHNTPPILDLLDKYGAKATFFCIGNKVEQNPEIAREIVKKGHLIGNHSYSHSNFFSLFGKKSIIREIRKTNQAITDATGEKCKIFRPPFGVTNPSIAKAIKQCGMKVLGWNIRSFDTTIKNPEKVAKRVLKKIKPGAILLLHDDRPDTAKTLEAILLYTKEHNYTCVFVPDLN